MYWIIYRRKGDRYKSERLARHVEKYEDLHETLIEISWNFDIIDTCKSLIANEQYKEGEDESISV